MRLAADVACRQLNKVGEELCGDAVEIIRDQSGLTVVLSDGLGSGVKANILATLTVKLAGGLVRRNVDLREVLEAIAASLPVCKERGIAYSTLSILHIGEDGAARLVEIGNPDALVFRGGEPLDLSRQTTVISNQETKLARFHVEPGDSILLVSDGVMHAGVEALFDLGLGPEGLIAHLPEPCRPQATAEELARITVELAEACSCCNPRDDITAVAVRIHLPRKVTICTGPPVRPTDDQLMVKRFLADSRSQHVICGGTSGQIIARETGRELEVEPEYADPAIPPTATIRGIDLVTEGVLTLNRCLTAMTRQDALPPNGDDGASRLQRMLLDADEVIFLVGMAQNPAHRDLETLVHLLPRDKIIDGLRERLERLGKRVTVEYF